MSFPWPCPIEALVHTPHEHSHDRIEGVLPRTPTSTEKLLTHEQLDTTRENPRCLVGMCNRQHQETPIVKSVLSKRGT